MRTVHSVINTSPPELLAEIILVDDFSTKCTKNLKFLTIKLWKIIYYKFFIIADLKEKLENYIKRFEGKVKIVRTKQREGLVRARVIGAEVAIGDVIVILDAHCECVVNWLPPLLTRIAVNRYNFIYYCLLLENI